ncbi:MAG: NUDIX hydrolase [bacterium]
MEKKISSKRIFDGRLLGVRFDKVKLENGVETTREVVEHPGAVAIIAITEEDELVLVKQFRYPTGEAVLEIPAGVPKKGEKLVAAAKRELEEETGYRPSKVKELFGAYSSPGYSDEMIHYCLATGLDMMGQNTDEDEIVEVEIVDIETCIDLVKKGKIKDNKTIIGIMLADQYINERAD